MSVQDDEIIQQDANTEESSAPQPQSADSATEASAAKSDEAPEQSDKQVPFHEHPRFKELIEERRQTADRLSQYERKMQEMEKQYQDAIKASQPAPKKHKFVEDLKNVDPAYAEYLESLETKVAKADTLEKQFQQMNYERLLNQYESNVSKAQSDAKVSPEVHQLIKQQLDAEAIANRVQIQDVPARYKQIAESYTKLLDSVKRAERASYVTDKGKDAASPTSQPKGKPAQGQNRNGKGQFTGDRETDLALIAKRALKTFKAEGDF